MKVYYLRFNAADFSKTTSALQPNGLYTHIWTTEVSDLYVNSQYKNYSIKKASYGNHLLATDATPNNTYTGINLLSPTTTEIGYVEDGRFIDTSGRIDILNWSLQFKGSLKDRDISTKLGVRTTEDVSSTPSFDLSDWVTVDNLNPGTPIYFIDSNRYVFFELNFSTEIDNLSSLELDLVITVEIDPPIVNGYFSATKKIQDKFPEWMAIREYDATDVERATPATPNSIGGKIINAIAGEWLTDIRSRVQYQQFQNYIDTADLDQKAWVYKTQAVPGKICSVVGDGITLAQASTMDEFYQSFPTEHCYLWNRIAKEVYTNVEYNVLTITDHVGVSGQYGQEIYQIWNSFDDIGLNVDLYRIQGATPTRYAEDNDSFRKRILDVYKNRPDITLEGFKRTLRRELNLWYYSSATPDSDFVGATPEVLELSDIETDPKYFDPDGMPTQAFKDLIEYLAQTYPMTWGYFRFGQAFWDADGLGHQGFEALPRRLDATPVDEQYRESGVGDGNDMYIFKPKSNTGKTTFDTHLKLRGRQKTTRSEYMPLTFDIQIYGRAAEARYTNPVITGRFTIELTMTDGNIYYTNITITDQNNTSYYNSTPSASLIDWTTADGYTSANYIFRNKNTGVIGATPDHEQIILAQVSRVDIKVGHYNGNAAVPAYENITTQSTYKAWFADIPLTIMGSGGAIILTKNPFTWATQDGSFYFQSQSVVYSGATPNNWVSDKYSSTINLNGVQPNMTVQNYTLDMPVITWPASTSSREYVIEILTNNGPGNYGAFSDLTAATPIFLPSTYIALDGNDTWTSGYQKTKSTATTSITFSSTTGAAYPTTASVWTLFNSAIHTIPGVVDENGPWRYGQSQQIGNMNYVLETLDLTRDDFAIPNTTDYIITWIGIESISDNKAIAWLESNTIKPAVLDGGENKITTTYPDNAIVETLNATTGEYEFSTVNIFAKLKPGVNKEWNPKAHSGWFHDDVDEYYMYASPGFESATGSSIFLNNPNRQGAPILINGVNDATPTQMRQVAFFEDSATPSLSLTNREVMYGNNTKNLYVAYQNIYEIEVIDITTGLPENAASTESTDNIVRLVNDSNENHQYAVWYKVVNSFYADASPNTTQIVFDKDAAGNDFEYYDINYETSIYDPATPIDIPLNGLFTSLDEGFIYIDHDIHNLNQVEIKVSPSSIVSDGIDYLMLTVRTSDTFGNPKPNQILNLFTNFGTLNHSSITTDRDGFGSALIQSTSWNGATPIIPATPALQQATPGGMNQGQILVDGDVDARLGFGIQIPPQPIYNIVAVLDSDYVLANKNNATAIFGLVQDPNHQPVPYATVYWRKARTIYELFEEVDWSTSPATPGTNNTGVVFADVKGRFTIGPFTSNERPGYWVVSVETGSASPNMAANQFGLVGDVVYWYEYPDSTSIVDQVTGQPISNVQDATPYWLIPSYNAAKFPTTYDESVVRGTYNATPVNWTPPRWWAINKYNQYQNGLYGVNFDTVGATPVHPEYKDF